MLSSKYRIVQLNKIMRHAKGDILTNIHFATSYFKQSLKKTKITISE